MTKVEDLFIFCNINLSNVGELGLHLEQCLPQGLVGMVLPGDYVDQTPLTL